MSVVPSCVYTYPEIASVGLVAFEDGTLLGAQLVCDRATDMIGELAVAVRMGLKLEDVAATIHPHPTFVEMIGQAAK